jgi:hypothetical protein
MAIPTRRALRLISSVHGLWNDSAVANWREFHEPDPEFRYADYRFVA